MGVNIKASATIEAEVYLHDGRWKTHPCNAGGWWGEDTCEYFRLDEQLEELKVPEGEYKITLTLEKIS